MKTKKYSYHTSTSISKNLVNKIIMSIVIATTVFSFTACSNYMDDANYATDLAKTATPSKSTSTNHTVLVYMDGKNDLTREIGIRTPTVLDRSQSLPKGCNGGCAK